jgi:hypothetical protein
MITLRIYDYRNGVLVLDLRDLVDLLAPRSLEADWKVSPVTLNDPHLGRSFDEFMVTGPAGPGQDDLERLAASGSVVSGVTLSEAAHAAHQVIWGQFVGTLPNQNDPWVVMCAINSTFYEVTSADQVVPNAIRSAYKDVRVASGPVKSIPIEQV